MLDRTDPINHNLMKRHALILLAFSQLALAGEIDLVDKQSGKVVATISQNNETEFLIEGKKYLARPKASDSEKLARAIIVPRIEVRGAHLEAVVNFLNFETAKHSPATPLNIMIGHKDLKKVAVDLKMIDANCYAILTAAAENAGCDVAFEEIGVIFRRKKPGE